MAMELFREVLRSVQDPDPLFQYETYLRESILQRYSLTVLLKPNLSNIQSNNLGPVLLKCNRYLKGSIRTVKVKTYALEDSNAAGVSRAGWRLFHLEGDTAFLDSLRPFPEDHLFPLGVVGVMIKGGNRVCQRKKDLSLSQTNDLQNVLLSVRCRTQGLPANIGIEPIRGPNRPSAKAGRGDPPRGSSPHPSSSNSTPSAWREPLLSQESIAHVLQQASGEVFRRAETHTENSNDQSRGQTGAPGEHSRPQPKPNDA